jgi:outer membrane protein assembly factor BamB
MHGRSILNCHEVSRMSVRAATLLLVASFCLPTRAGDWPQFRGPSGQGTSEAKNVPTEWSATKNVAWSVEIPGQAWSSPVLLDGKLYLTTAVTEKSGRVSLGVLCLDSADGKTLWMAEPLKPNPQAAIHHPKNSCASATPIVTADRIYCHFGHLGTAALDLKGNVVWQETELKYMPVHGNGGSPALVGENLIFSCDGAMNPFVACLDAGTGKVKWKVPRNTPAKRTFSFATPLAIDIEGATQVVLPGSGLVAAYEPGSGKELWRVLWGEGYSVVPRPIYSDGLLFCSSGFDAPIVYAIDPGKAKGESTKAAVAWTSRKDAPNTPSLVALGDEVYYVSDRGVLTCAEAKTGKVHWTHAFSKPFSASPVAAEGRVYLQTETGIGYVVKADAAKFELVSQNDLGDKSLASYAVDEGCLYIRTEHRLWKIGAK